MNLWAIVAIVVSGIVGVGGTIAYFEGAKTAAYNRGYDKGKTDTQNAMAETIRKSVAAALKRAESIRHLPPDKLDPEIERICREHGGGDACARKP